MAQAGQMSAFPAGRGDQPGDPLSSVNRMGQSAWRQRRRSTSGIREILGSFNSRYFPDLAQETNKLVKLVNNVPQIQQRPSNSHITQITRQLVNSVCEGESGLPFGNPCRRVGMTDFPGEERNQPTGRIEKRLFAPAAEAILRRSFRLPSNPADLS
jgi:hypothetical protein